MPDIDWEHYMEGIVEDSLTDYWIWDWLWDWIWDWIWDCKATGWIDSWYANCDRALPLNPPVIGAALLGNALATKAKWESATATPLVES
jgi:hypothetical protein